MDKEGEMLLENREEQNFQDGYLTKTIHHLAMNLIKKLKQLRKRHNWNTDFICSAIPCIKCIQFSKGN